MQPPDDRRPLISSALSSLAAATSSSPPLLPLRYSHQNLLAAGRSWGQNWVAMCSLGATEMVSASPPQRHNMLVTGRLWGQSPAVVGTVAVAAVVTVSSAVSVASPHQTQAARDRWWGQSSVATPQRILTAAHPIPRGIGSGRLRRVLSLRRQWRRVGSSLGVADPWWGRTLATACRASHWSQQRSAAQRILFAHAWRRQAAMLARRVAASASAAAAGPPPSDGNLRPAISPAARSLATIE
mmetsp:Transcript_33111/g.90645  ORF Transcript_33111/g.90645 Transcript_33111/m.90645 type:complete len:241 (+) Transcript_33111:291-1013(+)